MRISRTLAAQSLTFLAFLPLILLTACGSDETKPGAIQQSTESPPATAVAGPAPAQKNTSAPPAASPPGAPTVSSSETVNQKHLWNEGEFEAMLAKDVNSLKKFPDLPILTRVNTLNIKPPYFTGTLPISYESEDAANGSIPLQEISPGGHRIRYVYGNLDTANYVLPSGARASDINTGRILAEARLIEPRMGSMTPLEVMEIHFNAGGDVVFRSRSSFSKEFGGFKISESDVSGKKEREFFLWWPSGH